MDQDKVSASKVVLLTIQAAIDVDLEALRALVASHRRTLRTELILRILLTFLPETVASANYVSFLVDLASGSIYSATQATYDSTAVQDVAESDAAKQVRRLHLLPLTWPDAPEDVPDDLFTRFLIHRAYRVDEECGLITQLPELIQPFLERSDYLRTWMISSLLPLLRLNYEYHKQDNALATIRNFESLDDQPCVLFLLSRTGKDRIDGEEDTKSVGRDLRGLVGPWMYGNKRSKRRKLQWQTDSTLDVPTGLIQQDDQGWDAVCKWITGKATTSWKTCVEAVEQWDGPGDVDLGDYGDKSALFDNDGEQQYLEKRYARAALAAAYSFTMASEESLEGIQRIVSRVNALLDLERMPSLQAAARLLRPSTASPDVHLVDNATFLRSELMSDSNPLTTPNASALALLHSLVTSAYILTRHALPCPIRKAGELALLQDEKEQGTILRMMMSKIESGPKGDDAYWIRSRNELLWLHNWGIDHNDGKRDQQYGTGVLGALKKELLDTEVLKALLANTRYTLARSIYETSSAPPLPLKHLQATVIAAAMKAYDNASNANRTRGGVKKCDDILRTFPDSLKDSIPFDRIQHLIIATHLIGTYRLVLKQGEPFKPVDLRVHPDPIAIVGKILDQNSRCYTKINELIHMAEEMVRAGLTVRDVEGHSVMQPHQEAEQLSIARKRVTSLCVDAALAEDDFETAYSFVMTRLANVASEAQTRSPMLERRESGLLAQLPPRVLDDWSWRAAFQAGNYRTNQHTTRPTHLGNASGNPEIRHLEQRMDCLSQALRIAPPNTLQEIIRVFRRCEEELDSKVKQEAEQEAAWDEQGDQTVMPGGFGAEPKPLTLTRDTASAMSRTGEEAPMSIFDLTRASAAQAQRSLSVFTTLKGNGSKGNHVRAASGLSNTSSARSSGEFTRAGVAPQTVRKRDQLRNAAVGTLASGIGWLINAPTTPLAGDGHESS